MSLPQDKARPGPGIGEGIVFALTAGICAAAMYRVLPVLLPMGFGLRAVITAVTVAYVVYLVARSDQRSGRLSVIFLALGAMAIITIAAPGLVLFSAVHLGIAWLVRSLFFHASVLAALADLGLFAVGSVVATWAALQTGSEFMTVWSFFLVQALFCLVPVQLRRRGNERQASAHKCDRFDRAHRNAEAAVRKLSLAR